MAATSEYRVPAEIVIPITATEKPGLNDSGEVEIEISADVEHARIEVGDGVILGACLPSPS